MSLFCPNGKVLSSINANEYLEEPSTDEGVGAFARL